MSLIHWLRMVPLRVQTSELIKLRLNTKRAAALIVLTSIITFASNVVAEEALDIAEDGATSTATESDETIQNRIVGGSAADEGEWPSLVALVTPGDQNRLLRHFCGGSVIAERWILTAAHCMFNEDGSATTPDQVLVVAGINDFRDESAVETVVTNIYVHPEYQNGLALTNDLALMELATSVPVPANALSSVNPETLVGTDAFIAGWGLLIDLEDIVEGDLILPFQLFDASVPIVSLEQCNNPESYNGMIVPTQLCAGLIEGGVDSCQGDSGGPLYILEGARQVQVGIISWGFGCGRPNFYGVYTDVNAYRGWISNYITLDAAAITRSTAVVVGGDYGGSLQAFFIALLSGFGVFRFLSRPTVTHA